MADSLTREQRAMLEGMGRSAAEMLGKRPQPSLKVARGYIASAGEYTYDVLMADGSTLEDVPCLTSALGGSPGDEVRVEWMQGRALVTGVVATAANAATTTNLAPIAIIPTPNTDILNYSTFGSSIKRIGQAVWLQCTVILSSGIAWNSDELTLFTLPEEARPTETRYLPRTLLVITSGGAATYTRGIRVYPDGRLRAVNLSSGTDNVVMWTVPGIVYQI